jgi:hypothetical protein
VPEKAAVRILERYSKRDLIAVIGSLRALVISGALTAFTASALSSHASLKNCFKCPNNPFSSPSPKNRDFKLSNMLIDNGHNVFLAVNDIQFEELKTKCDKAYIGYSYNANNNNIVSLSNDIDKLLDKAILF